MISKAGPKHALTNSCKPWPSESLCMLRNWLSLWCRKPGSAMSRIKPPKTASPVLSVCRSLVGQVGHGRLSWDKRKQVTTFATPVGVVFGLVPATNPTSTFIFKVLICLKGRNAVILSPSQRALGVSNQLGELIQTVLREQGAPPDLVQWISSKNSRTTTLEFMEHP